jgi:hypothetical protein
MILSPRTAVHCRSVRSAEALADYVLLHADPFIQTDGGTAVLALIGVLGASVITAVGSVTVACIQKKAGAAATGVADSRHESKLTSCLAWPARSCFIGLRPRPKAVAANRESIP